MKAVQLPEAKKVKVVDIPEPVIGPEEVLVETAFVGLCGSDLNSYRGLSPMVTYPRIPGHEVSGIITDKGKAVPAEVEIGSKVMLSPYSNCGKCPACLKGRFNCCQYNQTLGVQRDGALTEKIAINYKKVFSHPDLTLEELALAEPLSVGYHAANRGRICETDTVLVLGCGAIGLGAIAAAERKGARVIGLDIDDKKLEDARKIGAHETVNSAKSDPAQAISKLTSEKGVNVAIEAVGQPATYKLAIETAAFAGRVVFIGYAKEDVSFTTKLFVSKELDIMGSRNALWVFPSVLEMLAQRKRPFSELISKAYPLDKSEQAFSDWDASPGDFTRILIKIKG